jgi:hypothetical protein
MSVDCLLLCYVLLCCFVLCSFVAMRDDEITESICWHSSAFFGPAGLLQHRRY